MLLLTAIQNGDCQSRRKNAHRAVLYAVKRGGLAWWVHMERNCCKNYKCLLNLLF